MVAASEDRLAGGSARLVERVNKLAALKPGWYDGAGEALTTAAVESGLVICQILVTGQDGHWAVFPSPEGGLLFEDYSPGVPGAGGHGRWVTSVDVLPTGVCEIFMLDVSGSVEDRDRDQERVGVAAGDVGGVLLELVRGRDLPG